MSRELNDGMKICQHFREEMFYTAMLGVAVRIGLRQSMPSSSIESCARLSETTPLSACGQTNRPRSRRLANRHRPSPSHHSTFTRSPRLPRKTNTWPEYGFCSSTVWATALRPVKPRRMSVMPAAIQMFVFDGREITGPVVPGWSEVLQDRLLLPRERVSGRVRSG